MLGTSHVGYLPGKRRHVVAVRFAQDDAALLGDFSLSFVRGLESCK